MLVSLAAQGVTDGLLTDPASVFVLLISAAAVVAIIRFGKS
jgi:hypothetical protein